MEGLIFGILRYVALYADDTKAHLSSKDIDDSAEEYINRDLKSISSRLTNNGFIGNIKSEVMLIGTNHAVKIARELQVILDDKPLKQSEHFTSLGLVIDDRLNWNDHIFLNIFQGLSQTEDAC